jgi:hypothetical protein
LTKTFVVGSERFAGSPLASLARIARVQREHVFSYEARRL